MALLFIHKVPGDNVAFEKKVKDIAYKLGINPNHLMFLMDFESGGTFSSSITNSYNCAGLIQFCPDTQKVDYKTINGVQYKLSDIKAMTNVQQLDLVYEYLRDYKGDIKNFYDVYLAILWPVALGKDDSYVIYTGTNPVFDLNKNGAITLAEVKQFLNDRVEKLVPSFFKEEFLKKKSDGQMEPVTKNFFQIYQRELIGTGIIVILLIALWLVYKQI